MLNLSVSPLSNPGRKRIHVRSHDQLIVPYSLEQGTSQRGLTVKARARVQVMY